MKYYCQQVKNSNNKMLKIENKIIEPINLNIDYELCNYKYMTLIKSLYIKFLSKLIDNEIVLLNVFALSIMNDIKVHILFKCKKLNLTKIISSFNIKIKDISILIKLEEAVNKLIDRYITENIKLVTVPIILIQKLDGKKYKLFVVKATSKYKDIAKEFIISEELLKSIILKFYSINRHFDSIVFLNLLYSSFLRYYSLNLGNYSATSKNIKNIIKSEYPTFIELFGNPFNSDNLYCSQFYTQERLFGCIDNYTNIIPYTGVYYLHPPNNELIIKNMIKYINKIFTNILHTDLIFIVLLSHNDYVKYFKDQKFVYTISNVKLNDLEFENYSLNFLNKNTFKIKQQFNLVFITSSYSTKLNKNKIEILQQKLNKL